MAVAIAPRMHRSGRGIAFAALAAVGCTAPSPPPRAEPSSPRHEARTCTAAAIKIAGVDQYGYRAAFRRTRQGARCAATELAIAYGYDHTPQYLRLFDLDDECAPSHLPFSSPGEALYWSDVAAADLDGDGADEIVASALADKSGALGSGRLLVVGGAALPLDGARSPSALAVGDVDEDGELDVVAATWAALPGAPTQVNAARRASIAGGRLLVLRGLGGGRFETAREVPASVGGAVDLELADVDLDGHLDLLGAGPEVTLVYGPLARASGAPLPRSLGATVHMAHDVEAAHAADGAAWIAASASCLHVSECKALGDRGALGVHLWRVGRDRRVEARFVATPGVPSAVHFSDLDGDGAAELIVGMMTGDADEADAGARRLYLEELGGYVGGAPLVLRGGPAGPSGPWERLDILVAGERQLPMTASILSYAPDDATKIERTSMQVTGSVVTYRGRGEVLGVAGVTMAGAPVAYHFTVGDGFITFAAPLPAAPADVAVEWRVPSGPGPGLLFVSASPLDGPTSGAFLARSPRCTTRAIQ
jgi:hypothetical protein